jgi:hypothetical protein
MTYSRGDVPEKEIFPTTHTTTSISDEIVRGRDLPRAGFDDCLRCDLPRAGFDDCLRCVAGRNCTFCPDRRDPGWLP